MTAGVDGGLMAGLAGLAQDSWTRGGVLGLLYKLENVEVYIHMSVVYYSTGIIFFSLITSR